jgi:inner membrane protein
MDLLTHAIVGAATAIMVARPQETRLAALAGGAAALLPDADALIRSSSDALIYFEYHRHFSHSLAFIPIGALLAAAMLWPLLRKQLAFGRLYTFCFLGYALAGVLDACTSYGTQLLWPFSNARVAWNIVSVFDPLFTLLLAVPLVIALRTSRPLIGAVSLLCGAAYLSMGAIQHHRALSLLDNYAREHAPRIERLVVKPTIGNVMLWRGIVQTPDRIYVAGIRPSLFGADRIYPGENAALAKLNDFDAIPPSRLHSDIERFGTFADRLLNYADSAQSHVQLGDARYAMLPTSLRPIWSVRFHATKPQQPVTVITDRQMSKEERARFIEMLLGRPY